MNWKKDDVITSDRLLAAFPNEYYKTDVLYANCPMVWRNAQHNPPSNHAKLIVSGHSDFPVTDDLVCRYPNAIWFGTNKQTASCNGLPLGITNDTDESDLHRIYGNVDMMVEVASQSRDIKNLAYMNFSIGTYPLEREKVWDMFKDKHWVTTDQPTNSMEGRKSFLEQARNHSFVLCPRGNGIDTHRLWETLYMGSIPIVKRDIAHSDWSDLPILFVDSWDEVTESRLKEEELRIRNMVWDHRKLHVEYWIDSIRNETRNHPHGN